MLSLSPSSRVAKWCDNEQVASRPCLRYAKSHLSVWGRRISGGEGEKRLPFVVVASLVSSTLSRTAKEEVCAKKTLAQVQLLKHEGKKRGKRT